MYYIPFLSLQFWYFFEIFRNHVQIDTGLNSYCIFYVKVQIMFEFARSSEYLKIFYSSFSD